jgi:hypothetical protein
MRVHPRHPDPGSLGQLLKAASRGVPIHPPTERVTQHRPLFPAFDGVLDRAGHRRR